MGSNLASEPYGTPREVCMAATAALEARGLRILSRSSWFRTAPVPVSDQPWFVNGVASVATTLGPGDLLALLHEVESDFGRVRRVRNEARVLDLDLLAYGDLVADGPEGPLLPHPRLQERAFVLLPLAEVAPDWHHPRTGRSVADMIRDLPGGQQVQPEGE